MRILVTGGAGFVGSALCHLLRDHDPTCRIVAFDNLRRRGSELNLPAFRERSIDFVHGDIRNRSDLSELNGSFDLMIEASAEPSVHAGTGGQSPAYLLDTNLVGTLNCLDYARQHTGGMIFLSTSRVYSIPALQELQLQRLPTRLELHGPQRTGASERGIAETFPVVGHGFRSLYGATKLASELFVEEYAANFGLPAVINRCGVIAGAGQFGKVDQGVYTLWVARHLFGGPLSYQGFGGEGLQVRDLLHPADLFTLLQSQWHKLAALKGRVFCAGGGLAGSVSLSEYTRLCEEQCGRRLTIGQKLDTAAVDIPYFVADSSLAEREFGWRPKRLPATIVAEIHAWLSQHRAQLEPLFQA